MFSMVACLTFSALLAIPGGAAGASSAPQGQSEAGWVTFNGTAKKTENNYRLTAADKNGVIDVPVDGVTVDGGTVKIKLGTTIRVIKEAKGTPDASSKPVEGCARRTCIGSVMICCNDARVVSACAGSFSCN